MANCNQNDVNPYKVDSAVARYSPDLIEVELGIGVDFGVGIELGITK